MIEGYEIVCIFNIVLLSNVYVGNVLSKSVWVRRDLDTIKTWVLGSHRVYRCKIIWDDNIIGKDDKLILYISRYRCLVV